jgi:molybdate transport system regulatory protein
MAQLSLRIDLSPGHRLGPGKIFLLEQIRSTGSISAAGRAMGMSYRRAWQLVHALNRTFRAPVVETKLGGKAGGGAELTDFGENLVSVYRDMELTAHHTLRERLAELEAATVAT